MIIIHQAIYGEKSGHGLLGSSITEDNTATRISGYTDLADRPDGGTLSEPIIRGFFVNDHFLLIKTFPDLNAERSGRVFSHTLIIERGDFYKLKSVTDLFRFFLREIDKDALMGVIEYDNPKKELNKIQHTNREVFASKALIEYEKYKNCIAWINEVEYWEWIEHIWSRLPKEEKAILRVGSAFSTQYIKGDRLNLIYIPSRVMASWEKEDFKLVKEDDSLSEESPSSVKWLLAIEEENDLIKFKNDFDLKVNNISTLAQLQGMSKIYQQLNNSSLTDLLVLSDYVSRSSPKDGMGKEGKEKLFKAIEQKISKSLTVEEFSVLMYQSWNGFSNVINKVEALLISKLNDYLKVKKQGKKIGRILLQAIEYETPNWWTKFVRSTIVENLKNVENISPEIIWSWLKTDHKLIELHKSWLPRKNLEQSLIQKSPTFDQSLSDTLLVMAKEKDWKTLHGLIAAKSYNPRKAILKQLEIDTDKDHTRAFQAMALIIKDSDFIKEASSNNDERLFQIAGGLVKEKPSHLELLKIDDDNSQKIWEEYLLLGGEVWGGISKPKEVLFEIIDHISENKEFSEKLLAKISESSIASLYDYPDRKEVWEKIPSSCLEEFKTATLIRCIPDLLTKTILVEDIEDLNSKLKEPNTINRLIEDNSISNNNIIQLFGVIDQLSELHARRFAEKAVFNAAESKSFGNLILQRQWKTVAIYCYNNYKIKNDLALVLEHCSSLLSLLQKLRLSVIGIGKSNLSYEDWWQLFYETAIELYPNGPSHLGLWTRAGGRLEDLQVVGTGKEIWSLALVNIKNGIPNLANLLNAMKNDYPSNEKLHQLILTS